MIHFGSPILLLAMLLGTVSLDAQTVQPFGVDAGRSGGISISVNVNEDNRRIATPLGNPCAKIDQPPPAPPTMPPMEASLDPKRLIRFFCRMWKDEDYSAMYLCMAKQYRRNVTLQKFSSLFEEDANRTGGLEDENILAEDGENAMGHMVVVDLKFRRKKAPNRRVKALLEKTKDGYRIIQSGILPVDFGNL